MHKGDVVTVEGEIMHKPKASALSIDSEASDSLRVTCVALSEHRGLLK